MNLNENLNLRTIDVTMAGSGKGSKRGAPKGSTKRKQAPKKARRDDEDEEEHTAPSQVATTLDNTRPLATDVSRGHVANGRTDIPSNVFQVRTGQPIVGTDVPGVINVGDVLSAGGGSGSLSRRGFYELCRESGRQGSEAQMIADLVSYVRHDLFPKWKFFMSRHQLVFSLATDSICVQICNGMGVYEHFASKWWEEYHDKILETLNSKRADVTACIKRAFLSTYY
jgi:hypothetical protein